jgi:phosphoribosylformimino-5-aminoimidazole carboxamide ribotide isomerase
MKLYPAIDLKDGNCVRLYKGDMEQATIFSDSPPDQAKKFESEGAEWIHIVDLNGAFAGEPVNLQAVKDIINSTNIKLQLGGGIRDLETIKMWLDAGISRVILGTVAVKNPELVKQACQKFPNQIAVGLDARDGYVATEGWAEKSQVKVNDLAKKFEETGVSAIIYTDISKDGAMSGADFEGTKNLADSVNIPIILSGGISSLDDIKSAKKLEHHGVEGVISGRALYENAFSISQANEVLK